MVLASTQCTPVRNNPVRLLTCRGIVLTRYVAVSVLKLEAGYICLVPARARAAHLRLHVNFTAVAAAARRNFRFLAKHPRPAPRIDM